MKASPLFECQPALKGLRLLVVDDGVDAREVISTILEHCGADVKGVASVAEALAALNDNEW